MREQRKDKLRIEHIIEAIERLETILKISAAKILKISEITKRQQIKLIQLFQLSHKKAFFAMKSDIFFVFHQK